MEHFDLVIIGAGIHGLITCKTYRDVNPNATILVVEKGGSLGGVWAKERLYPGLRTNNHFGTFEFSGYPMSSEGFGPDDHIPGQHVNQYLLDYAKEFDLARHIRFNYEIETALDEGDDGWILTVANSGTKIKAARLVVATGITSQPSMPKLVGEENFGAPIYHSSVFAYQSDGLGTYKNVVLLSGSKFSWDVACAYASAGIQVDWIIRESGHGPCWMTPNRLTPLKVVPELLLQTRFISWLSPCIWANADGYPSIHKFFNQHWLGRKIVDGFFNKVEHSILEANNYDSHPETAKLKPWTDIFFIGTNRGLLNYPVDFFELVRKGLIKVHIADIERLTDHAVHLSNGTTLQADILICGTGWKDTPPLKFVTERPLGFPGSHVESTWKYISQADTEILEKCPKLAQQPYPRKSKTTSDPLDTTKEPYRLYRFMVPPAFVESKTLAFAGVYRSASVTIIAQAQALWITAFFGRGIPSLLSNAANSERILYETVLHSQFGKWRYSRGFGARFPELWMDSLPYIDMLLNDVGVNCKRKNGWWWNECFTAYRPSEYEGIVEEFMRLRQLKGNEASQKKAQKEKAQVEIEVSRIVEV